MNRDLKFFLIVILTLLTISSCATLPPNPSLSYNDITEKNPKYVNDINTLELAKISNSQKANAKSLIYEYHCAKSSIIDLIKKNDAVITANESSLQNFNNWNKWLSGIGSIASLTALADYWGLTAPVVTGLWNLIGVDYSTSNVKTYLDKGLQLKSQIQTISNKYDNIGNLFEKFTTDSDSTSASINYSNWFKELKQTLNYSNQTIGIPPLQSLYK